MSRKEKNLENVKSVFRKDDNLLMYSGRDLSPLDQRLYKRYFTLDIDEKKSRGQLLLKHFELEIPDKVDFTVLSAHGSFQGNNFINVPQNVIVLVIGDDGHMTYDQQVEFSKLERSVTYGYMMLFIQYLHFLSAILQGTGVFNKQIIRKYWHFYTKSIQDYWSLNGPGTYFSNHGMHRILPYFEGDLLPDTELDFRDAHGSYYGAYSWYEYDERMRQPAPGLQPFASINKQYILSHLTPTFEMTFGSFLDKKCKNIEGTSKLAIILMFSCRHIQSHYVDICLLPSKMTLFKNLLHDYKSLINSSFDIKGDMDLSVYKKYGFGLEMLTTRQTDVTLYELRKMFEKIFSVNENKDNHGVVKERLLKFFITRMFYSKYCFSNIGDEIISIHKKNHIITYHDAMKTPKDPLKRQTMKRFNNVYVPVRDIRGIPCYFGYTESFTGQEYFGQPDTIQSHLLQLPVDQMYYYSLNHQGKMLSILFDVGDKRSIAINNLARFGYIYKMEDRKKIFELWTVVAEPLIKPSVWPSYAKVMKDLFVYAIPLEDVARWQPYFSPFLNNYKLFLLQWPKKGNEKGVEELVAETWLSDLFEKNPWRYYHSTVFEIGPWKHLRRGLKVAYLTPLEYALCNFYLHGNPSPSTMTLYELLSHIWTGEANKDTAPLSKVTHQDIVSTAGLISFSIDSISSRADVKATAENLIDHVSFLINTGRHLDLERIPLSILTRLKIKDYFVADNVANHLLTRLPENTVYQIRRDYIIADYSAIFTVRHSMIIKLESLTDILFQEYPEKLTTSLIELFDFYFSNVYFRENFLKATVPKYTHFETYNFFQLLFLEQELLKYR